MDIEEIVKKHRRWLKHSNNPSLINTLKEDLRAEGFKVLDVTLAGNKLVIRTDNSVYVETF
jgi:hypothetical protein